MVNKKANEIEKRVELIGIAVQLVAYVEAAEAACQTVHRKNCVCVKCEDFKQARKSLGLEDK